MQRRLLYINNMQHLDLLQEINDLERNENHIFHFKKLGNCEKKRSLKSHEQR